MHAKKHGLILKIRSQQLQARCGICFFKRGCRDASVAVVFPYLAAAVGCSCWFDVHASCRNPVSSPGRGWSGAGPAFRLTKRPKTPSAAPLEFSAFCLRFPPRRISAYEVCLVMGFPLNMASHPVAWCPPPFPPSVPQAPFHEAQPAKSKAARSPKLTNHGPRLSGTYSSEQQTMPFVGGV